MATTDRTATPVKAATLDDEQARSLIVNALHAGAPSIVVQPILGLTTGRAVAYEALSRFNHNAARFPPERWFAIAHQAGLGAMFEARAVDLALRLGASRPTGTVLSVNVSPSVLSSPELHNVLPFDLSGLQFEITEKEVVDDPAHLAVMLDALRSRGAHIAVDDVGEGYAGLQRVMSISPDVLKLDRSLVTGVEAEPGKAAMIDAIVRYAAKVGAQVCAEGVESLEDLYVLADLDVAEAQGWAIGMPTPAFENASEAAQLTCESSFARALALGGRTGPNKAASDLEQLLGRLVDTADLDSLARLMKAVAETLRCDRVELSYLDPTGQYLEAVRPEAWKPEGIRYYLSEYPQTQHALQTQHILQVVVSDPMADAKEIAWMKAEGVQTLIGVPIVSAGRPIGFIECCKLDETPWSRMQLRHSRIIATVLGPVLDTLQPTVP
jgi:EAL domain-containing protein (putative c-di-GMP-specific phosphodiesterase class I)